ncbi:MAG: hypothetical protein HGA71_17860 [Azonexaceae bacterium]|nr:hypothetical protein [Azonexaceae bacterium]
MQKPCSLLLPALAVVFLLAGCATSSETVESPSEVVVVDAAQSTCHAPADVQRIADLEKQIGREQRQCLAEKRRLETALRESQKQNDELQKKLDDLQKKLDALLAIDRDLRSRNRSR